MVVRFIAENLALDQLGGTRRVICTVLWIGVLGLWASASPTC